MKVKVIDKCWRLTTGEIYKVIKTKNSGRYLIKNNVGVRLWYHSNRFMVVPKPIKKVICTQNNCNVNITVDRVYDVVKESFYSNSVLVVDDNNIHNWYSSHYFTEIKEENRMKVKCIKKGHRQRIIVGEVYDATRVGWGYVIGDYVYKSDQFEPVFLEEKPLKKVKCLSTCHNLHITVGKTYPVLKNDTENGVIHIVNDLGIITSYFNRRFDPIPEEKPIKKVRCIDISFGLTYGKAYDVIDKGTDNYGVYIEDDNGKERWLFTPQFNPITEEKILCIEPGPDITVGKTYNVLREDRTSFLILNDNDVEIWYLYYHFTQVVTEPTSDFDTAILKAAGVAAKTIKAMEYAYSVGYKQGQESK